MAGRPPKTASRAKLPNAEVQALADTALRAWEGGAPEHVVDSLGGVWDFLAVRDPAAALEISRLTYVRAGAEDQEEVTHRARIPGNELGATDNVAVVLASRVLALADPPAQSGGG